MSKTILSAVKKASTFYFRETEELAWEDLSKLKYNPERLLDRDLQRTGFVHPLEKLGLAPEDTVLEEFEGGYITALRTDKSVVTATALSQAAAAEIAARLEELPEDVGLDRDQRAAISEAVRSKLITDAPVVSKYIPLIIDLTTKRIILFDNGSATIDKLSHYLNNVFAGKFDLIPWSAMAAKSDIGNIGAVLLSKLETFLTTDVDDSFFEEAPNLSFGTGVKLQKLDSIAGNDANLPQFDLGDITLTDMVSRAEYVERMGFFCTLGQIDIDFIINSKLQFLKLGLGSMVDVGLEEDVLEDQVAELHATATLLLDGINRMVNEVSKFLGIMTELD